MKQNKAQRNEREWVKEQFIISLPMRMSLRSFQERIKDSIISYSTGEELQDVVITCISRCENRLQDHEDFPGGLYELEIEGYRKRTPNEILEYDTMLMLLHNRDIELKEQELKKDLEQLEILAKKCNKKVIDE